MQVDIYIQGQKLEQFDDETITINRSIKNISDISKVFTDFTQSFTVPASANNNTIFKHWYNADVDNGFNSLLRVDAHIEIKTLPFRYGSVQLNSAKLKNGLPYAYDITFFGKSVNLSDLFGDDLLSSLDFEDYNHDYDSDTVTDAISQNTIASGDVYYPLISSTTSISLGNGGADDIINSSNSLNWLDLKPALRHLRIIEAIENKYNVQFSRVFFDRAIFYNYFLWLHAKKGRLEAFGSSHLVDLTVDESGEGFDFDATNDTITYTNPNSLTKRGLSVRVNPDTGFESVPYVIEVFNYGVKTYERTGSGVQNLTFSDVGTFEISLKISSSNTFDFSTVITGTKYVSVFPPYPALPYLDITTKVVTTSIQTITALLQVSSQMPEFKIKDYFSSLIAEFNLIIEFENNIFNIDTLDNWYSNGKFYDITKYVDINDITIKKPDAKKQINFLYQKTGAVLGDAYFKNTGTGYGDLKAEYNIDGTELKIETQFENLMFERLQHETTGDISDIQVGFAIDDKLEPYIGKPFSFYKNGFTYSVDDLYIQPNYFNRTFHTATEDNIVYNQVTNSLNFGSDNSTFFQVPIENSLYFNFYKNYIEDLYNSKTRVLNVKCFLPISIIYKLNLNDKLTIQDKKYKISSYTINLTTRETTLELFTDLGLPADSYADTIPLTVDSTLITVDSDLITVDTTSTHEPIISYITNGISFENYTSTAADESFELKITANTSWSIVKDNLGFGDTWFNSNIVLGSSTTYVRISLDENTTGDNRSGKLIITIGGVDFELTILQLA